MPVDKQLAATAQLLTPALWAKVRVGSGNALAQMTILVGQEERSRLLCRLAAIA